MKSKKEVLEGWSPVGWQECVDDIKQNMNKKVDYKTRHNFFLHPSKKICKQYNGSVVRLRITIEEIPQGKKKDPR